MRMILRVKLPPSWSAVVEMPRGAIVRGLDLLGGAVGLFVEADTEQPSEKRTFVTVATGQPWQTSGAYIGSYVAKLGEVLHVYEPLEVLIPAELRALLPTDEARAAYRLLIKEGFTLGGTPIHGWYWIAPDDEPLTTEQMTAVGELMLQGFHGIAPRA